MSLSCSVLTVCPSVDSPLTIDRRRSLTLEPVLVGPTDFAELRRLCTGVPDVLEDGLCIGDARAPAA